MGEATVKKGRGRPKGSGKKPNPELAPVGEGPGAGHNQLTDEQRAALFAQHLPNLERAIEALTTASSTVRHVRKAMKADGFSKIEVDYALYLRKKPEADALGKLQAELRVATWLNHPIGHQATLFDEDRRPDIDRARDAGHFAGIEGKPMKPPFDSGNERHEAWVSGWHEGQITLSKGIGKAAE
jgi:ribosome modulation factor